MNTELPLLDRAPERYEDPLDLMDEIEALKKEKDATILAHYYVDGEIQDVADFVGDSLKLSRDAAGVQSSVIVFSGVHFMAETAKMLNPQKKVLIPDLLAGCSLAESCPYDKLLARQQQLRAEGRDFETVAYINTTAAVKSLCDWIVTSGNAREIIDRVPKDKEILFVPDQHLGRYLEEVTGRKMILWPGSCMVHEIFSLQDLLRAKRNNPGSIVLAHPECPQNILEVSDVIAGTEKMRKYVASIASSDEVPDRDRSQHDLSAAKGRPAARIHSRAGNHDLVGSDVRLQSLSAHGAEHAGESCATASNSAAPKSPGSRISRRPPTSSAAAC